MYSLLDGKILDPGLACSQLCTASLKPSQGQGFSHPKLNTILINTYSEKQILKFWPTDLEGGAHNISLKVPKTFWAYLHTIPFNFNIFAYRGMSIVYLPPPPKKKRETNLTF